MKKVMAFGTFDLFHKGHENYLKQAKKQGDFLIVIVARDQNVELIKGVKPTHDENERVLRVEKSGIAEKVVLGSKKNKLWIIIEEKPEILCLGYDQEVDEKELKEKLLKDGLNCEIKRMKGYHCYKYKSSIIKKGNSFS